MVSVNIMLNSIKDVKDFVNIVNQYDFDVELVLGKYVIDAKSIMGIFSLDLSQKLLLQADCEGNFFAKRAAGRPRKSDKPGGLSFLCTCFRLSPHKL